MTNKTAEYWIEKLGLQSHVEGGFWKSIFASPEKISNLSEVPRFKNRERVFYTHIYYLLRAFDVSMLHRLLSDEIFHHYAGDPCQIHCLNTDGSYTIQTVGANFDQGQTFSALIPHGTWFGATPLCSEANSAGYTLVGCSVAPGFDFEDFEFGSKKSLLKEFPQHAAIIERLGHP